jgi:hypothetical protein
MVGFRRTLADFGPLTAAEQILRDGVSGAATVILGDGTTPPADAGEDRQVRAGFIRYLALGGCDDCRPAEKGVQLRGALVVGDGDPAAETRGLDLEGCTLSGDLGLFFCRFPDQVLLRDATLRSLCLDGSTLSAGLSAERMQASGGVYLQKVALLAGVRLTDAGVGGDLGCDGASLAAGRDDTGDPLEALAGDGLDIHGNAVFSNTTVTGELRLAGAKLGGSLHCNGAVLTALKDRAGDPRFALNADGLEARQHADLRDMTATGTVFLQYARLGGILMCGKAALTALTDAMGKPGAAFGGDGLDVQGGAFLDNIRAVGEVRLVGARLGGSLDCNTASFTALADGDGKPGFALNAGGLKAAGNADLRHVTATGTVQLLYARFDGILMCGNAVFTAQAGADGTPGKAVAGGGLDVGGNAFIDRVTAKGEVNLTGARFGGDLDCQGADFAGSPAGKGRDGTDSYGRALSLDRARVEGAFFWRGGVKVRGALDLRDASFGTIDDDAKAWPGAGDLALNRCRYGAFTGQAVSGAERIRWLSLQDPARWGSDFWPQPHEHCAKVLREMGHVSGAKDVLIEKERLQRRAARARAWHGNRITGLFRVSLLWLRDAALAATLRYGHRPMLAFLWLGAFFLLGTLLFGQVERADALKPNNSGTLSGKDWVSCAGAGAGGGGGGGSGDGARDGESQLDCFLRQPGAASYPVFNAAIYSADTLLPIVDFEMQRQWSPDESKAPWGLWGQWYLWGHNFVGWALSLLAVAGFSGLVKKD